MIKMSHLSELQSPYLWIEEIKTCSNILQGAYKVVDQMAL